MQTQLHDVHDGPFTGSPKQRRVFPTVRRCLFWLHLAVGLLVAVAIAFLALTGILLSFQAQLTHFAERNVHPAVRPSATACLPLAGVVARAQEQAHVRATSISVRANASQPALLTVRPDTVFLVDPCSGDLLQSAPSHARAFFASVKDLHRWVAVAGTRHESLRGLKNAANLGFSFLVLSGLVLWLPRATSRAALRSALLVRRGLQGRAREWNLHNTFGFWFAVPLLLLSVTGTIMAYGWANSALYRAAGSPPPKPAEEKVRENSAQSLEGLDALLERARMQDPAWHQITVRLPAQSGKTVSLTLDDTDREAPRERSQLTLKRNGAVGRWEPFQALPRGRQWRLLTRYLHTGELFGIAGQAVAALACLAALLLVWSGVSLSLRRLAAFLRRRARTHRPVTVATRN